MKKIPIIICVILYFSAIVYSQTNNPVKVTSAFQIIEGTIKLSYTTGGRVHCSPAIGSDGTIYVGSDDNTLYAVTSQAL